MFPPYLACVVACVVMCILSVNMSDISTLTLSHICNTYTIHANTDWHVLNTYLSVLIHNGMYSKDTTNTYHNTCKYMPIHQMFIGMY